MADEFGVTFCEDIICLQSLPVCFIDPSPFLLNSTWTDTLVIKPVVSMLLIPKPTTGHNPVPVVSTYSSHSFLTSHPLRVIRCCFPGCMQILCAFLVCPILATLVLYTKIILFFLYSYPLNHTLNFCCKYAFHYVCWVFPFLLS